LFARQEEEVEARVRLFAKANARRRCPHSIRDGLIQFPDAPGGANWELVCSPFDR
jgi:hypothetical protein